MQLSPTEKLKRILFGSENFVKSAAESNREASSSEHDIDKKFVHLNEGKSLQNQQKHTELQYKQKANKNDTDKNDDSKTLLHQTLEFLQKFQEKQVEQIVTSNLKLTLTELEQYLNNQIEAGFLFFASSVYPSKYKKFITAQLNHLLLDKEVIFEIRLAAVEKVLDILNLKLEDFDKWSTNLEEFYFDPSIPYIVKFMVNKLFGTPDALLWYIAYRIDALVKRFLTEEINKYRRPKKSAEFADIQGRKK
jgi:hypothetical protein